MTKTLEEKGIEVALRAESIRINAAALVRRADQLDAIGRLMKHGIHPSQVEKFLTIEPRGSKVSQVHTRVWLKGGDVKLLMNFDIREMRAPGAGQ